MLTILLWRSRLFPSRGGSLWARCRHLAVVMVRGVLRWRQRARDRHYLAALDDRMLSDIGIGRAEALREADKPFWRP
jgi:uncharacterized protein YjiS (DUF1127 family)